jgi:hypothetical protein
MPAATSVIRHESDASRWELVLRDPDTRSRAEVLALEGYDERAVEPVRQRHFPSAFGVVRRRTVGRHG